VPTYIMLILGNIALQRLFVSVINFNSYILNKAPHIHRPGGKSGNSTVQMMS